MLARTRRHVPITLASTLALCLLAACAGNSGQPATPDGAMPSSDGPSVGSDALIINFGDATVDVGPSPDLGADTTVSAPDTLPPRDIERTLGFSGTGSSQWLHIFFHAAGASSISVRSLRLNEALAPPFASVSTENIPEGQCRKGSTSGTLSDGRPFSTEVEYCYGNEIVQVSHTATIDDNPPNAPQVHGTLSLDPSDVSRPYERSLRYVNASGGAEWNHVARRAPGATGVDVESWSYNPNLAPATRTFTVTGVAPGTCKNRITSGTILSSGQSFSTRVQYCRVGDQLEIAHTATIDGVTGETKDHGALLIE